MSPGVTALEFQNNSESSPVENMIEDKFYCIPSNYNSDCKSAGDIKD